MLATGHMSGTVTVTIPGHPAPPGECPADLLEREPEPPKLNIMVARKDLYPEVPAATIRQWMSSGPEFLEEFQKFLDKLNEEYGPLPTTNQEGSSGAGAETGVGGANGGEGQGTPNVQNGANGAGSGSGKKRRTTTPAAGGGKRPKVDRAKLTPTTETFQQK